MPDRSLNRTFKWSNGIMPRAGGPMLSWFQAPLSSRSSQAWIDCISAELSAAPEIGKTPSLKSLMERFKAAHVFDPANRASQCQSGLRESTSAERVLLIDEPVTYQFQSSRRERKRQFACMTATARADHPSAELWFARSGSQESKAWLSCGNPEWQRSSTCIDARASLCASIPYFDHVYTLSAPEGMQALLHGIPLHVFGTPYYAGWGLTSDYIPQPARQTTATLAALFEAVFLRLACHLDPLTHARGPLEAFVNAIDAHRATVMRFVDLEHVAGIRFQWWKRPLATPYLTAGGSLLRWIDHAHDLRQGEHAVFWGARDSAGLPHGASILRIEDGFLHSTGLGSDHVAPCSQILDRRGLYFDPSQPSDLTVILNESSFGAAELARASSLRRAINRLGLTKYNLGRRRPEWVPPADRCVVLVLGQVADDASIRLGTRDITTTEDLLRAVRERRPDAFIVYKPHPDVLSGNRRGLIETGALVDLTESASDLISLIELADEVHTLSSLSGFEALIRGKDVYTYGLPFYAGWGLTHDALPQPWRQRTLSLDMLTAGVLLRYPIYWDWSLRLFTTPEAIIAQLAAPAARPLTKVRDNRLRPLLKAFRWSMNGLRHLVWRCRNGQSHS